MLAAAGTISQFWLFTLTITLCPRSISPHQWSTLLAWWLSNLGTGDNVTVRFGVRRLCGSIWWKEWVSYMSHRSGGGGDGCPPWIPTPPHQRWLPTLQPYLTWWRGKQANREGMLVRVLLKRGLSAGDSGGRWLFLQTGNFLNSKRRGLGAFCSQMCALVKITRKAYFALHTMTLKWFLCQLKLWHFGAFNLISGCLICGVSPREK